MYFDDVPSQSKVRPVLVLDGDLALILSLKITSHPPRTDVPGEYALVMWKESGLLKPSTVRVSQLLELNPDQFRKRIGVLREPDRSNIEAIFSGMYGLDFHF